MNFLIWRLHRNQAFFALLVLAALSTLLLITGTVMANDYHHYLSTCASTQSCGQNDLFRGDGAIMDIVDLTLVIPLLFGLFWGVPLLAKEFEDGTHNLAWTQSVTRRHWLRTNLVWAFLAAALWGAALSALVSWWRGPENALDTRFDAFDIQGIVPVAYAIFAVALGLAVGAVFRRVLPALATTLGVFLAVRVPIAIYLRPHFMTALTKSYPLRANVGAPVGSWTISNGIVGPGGRSLGRSFFPGQLPSACTNTGPVGKGIIPNCLADHGYRQLVSYQPASRFWAFQGIEAGIFVVLAIALVAFVWWRVMSRDA